MSAAFASIQRLKMPGWVNGLDFSTDGKHWAVSFYRNDGGPGVRLYRTEDNQLEAEYGEGAAAARGVAFAGGEQLCYMVHIGRGGAMFRVTPSGPEQFVGYSARMTETLVRDRKGRFLGIGGESFVVYDTESRQPVDVVVCDAEKSGMTCHGWFSPDPTKVFLYGKTAGKIVLYDWMEKVEVAQWPAPQEFGDYVTASRSGRYLAGIAFSGKGLAIYDVIEKRSIPLTGVLLAGMASFDRFPVFMQDESSMIVSASNLWAFGLPELKWMQGPELRGGGTTAVAGAFQHPLMAFGYIDGDVAIVRVNV